jgi:hypothetical protein
MYRCKVCSAVVFVADGKIIRVCEHEGAAVIAEASAEAAGRGGVK